MKSRSPFTRSLSGNWIVLWNSCRLIEELHRFGLNVRHLGLVRRRVNVAIISRLLLHELVARSLKSHINLALREKSKLAETTLSEEPFKALVIGHLNAILRYLEG